MNHFGTPTKLPAPINAVRLAFRTAIRRIVSLTEQSYRREGIFGFFTQSARLGTTTLGSCFLVVKSLGLDRLRRYPMNVRRTLIAATFLVALWAASAVSAGIPFTDEFDNDYADGDPVTWARWFGSWGLGDLTVRDGSLVITPPTDWETNIYAEGQQYRDVDVLTRVRALADGTTAVAIGALNSIDGSIGVWAYFVVDGSNHYMNIQYQNNGPPNLLGQVNTNLSHITDEMNLRLNVIESTMTFKAWPEGSPEPAYPQVIAARPDSLRDTEGYILVTAGNLQKSVPVAFRSVQVETEPWKTGPLLLLPKSHYSVRDTTTDGVLDNLGDTAISATGSAVVGELDTTDNDYIGRLVAKFTLPDLAEYPPLERAALRYSVTRVEAPAGPLSILHSVTDNDLNSVATDFEDTSYVDTQKDLLSPNDLPGNYFEVDVTEQILTDLANEGAAPVSAFRFQVSEANFVEDNTSHDYRLRVGNISSSTPMLVLSFVPEPSTWSLGFLALVAASPFLRRRRSSSFTSIRLNDDDADHEAHQE